MKLKTIEEIKILQEGGAILAKILKLLSEDIKPGLSTKEINDRAHKLMFKFGGKPAFLGYRPPSARRPYPASLCVSINEEIVHGIPNENPKILQEGDIVSLDAGLIYKGLITDSAVTVSVGEIPKEVKKLLQATQEALIQAIKAIRPNGRIGDIGSAVERVAQKYKLNVVEGLGGHSVGYEVHEEPYIPNFGKKGQGEKILPGMVLAIEPMLSMGSPKIKLSSDGYTYFTQDESLSAHFEHTVAVTEKGVIILTK